MIIAQVSLNSGVEISNAYVDVDSISLKGVTASIKYSIYVSEGMPAVTCGYLSFAYAGGNITDEAENAVKVLIG